ncbi:MAG: hypothetical protein DMF87_21285, partial [Acidobacteria bacterium]
MRRLPILVCLATLIAASDSPTIHASDEPPFTALASSTYLGNDGFDEINDMVVDGEGFVYVAGWADYGWSTDGFVAKLSPDGSQVVYFTWIGGSAFDIANSLALDGAGGVVVAGHTTSTDFPIVNGFQTELHGDSDVWIAKLDAAGNIAYSTYYGGSSFENGMAMAIGPTGAIYVTGSTASTDLPGAGGLQAANAGGFADGFVVKILPDGSGPEYATYLGGSGNEFVTSIAVDATDHAVIAGATDSWDLPLANAFQPTYRGGYADAFITKLSSDGARAVFSTYAGGFDSDSADAVTVDADGNVYVTGGTSSFFDFPITTPLSFEIGGWSDALLMKLTPDGGLVYSTLFGGYGEDVGRRIHVDGDGDVHIAGYTDSFNFPLIFPVSGHVNFVDAFYAKFAADGQTLLRATPLGGSQFDNASSLALDPTGGVWLGGMTNSSDFPAVNAYQSDLHGSSDAFLSHLTLTFEEPAPPNKRPVAIASDHMVFGDGCGTQVTLDGSGSSDPDGDQLQYTWSSWMFGDMPGLVQTITLMPGNYWFTLTVDDGRGGRASQTVTVTVVDNVPPQIGAVFATPTVLGPPNHKMADIGFSMELNSECHQDFECRIVNVVGNEPIDGLG